MATTQLNAAQLNVISLMSSIDTEQEQQKLQNILLEFYRNKLDSLLLQFQQDNNITQTITSDRDDNKFVDCAIVAGAKFIVSNDKAFAELKNYAFPQVDVCSLADIE